MLRSQWLGYHKPLLKTKNTWLLINNFVNLPAEVVVYGQKTVVSGQKTVDSRQKTVDSRQKTVDSRQKTVVRHQWSEISK